MKIKTLFLLLLPIFAFAQEEPKPNKFFTQFEVAVPFVGNSRYDELTGERAKPRIMIDGLSSKFGIGIHQNKWLGLSVHSGIDWKLSNKLVAVPVYANIRIAPDFGDDARLILQGGYGFVTAIGRGNLSGDYSKVSIGLGDADRFFYLEYSRYGFMLHDVQHVYSISLGIAVTAF